MKKIPITNHFPGCSSLAFGCMNLGGGWNDDPITREDEKTADEVINTCLDLGINFFDHADIYGKGKSEAVFGKVLRSNQGIRSKIIIQSKGGIRFQHPKRYDFSTFHIKSCVEGSLKRLNTDYLDIWLLHRPDPLMEPEEIAEVFSGLKAQGKVRYFGVSNMHLHQIQFLQSYLKDELIVNQIEMSLGHLDWLDEGVLFGNKTGKDLNFTPGTIEYCQMNKIQIQSWGSLAQGIFSGRDATNKPESVRETAKIVKTLSEKYDCSEEGIVLAWLMRHPAGIQPIFGTINPVRIKACNDAVRLSITHEEWYELYVSARGVEMP